MPLTPLKYFTLSDFSPGIWSTGYSDLGSSYTPAPIGAARPDRTRGCIALPSGGLGPLPSSTLPGGGSNTITLPTALPGGESVRGGTQCIQLNGLEVFGNIIAQTSQSTILTPEIHVGFNWVNTTNHERFKWYYYNMSSPGAGWTLAADKTENGFVGNLGLHRPSIFSTALTYTTTGFPQPILIGNWIGGGFGGGAPSLLAATHYRWWMPNPTGIAAPQEVSSANNVGFGQVHAHQSRVLVLRAGYQNHIAATTFNRNNNEIDYTDPPLTTTMGTQGTILSAETAEGFGAIGSVSSGVLFLVKKRGGALIMYDDIVYPKVVGLPSVVSTGLLGQRGSFCSMGMVYAVDGSGMYAWDGSSSSQLISPQLEPEFFKAESPSPSNCTPMGTLSYDTWVSHVSWLGWIVVAGGWLFNPTNGSWWRLEALASKTADKFVFASAGPLLFGSVQWNPSVLRVWDGSRLATDYVWSGHGVAVSPGKKVSVREVEVIFSAGSTAATVNVDLYNDSQVITQLSFSPTTVARPWRETKKLPTPIYVEQIKLDVTCDSHNADIAAPIVHSVSVGYTEDRSAASPWT